jgi:uncharacterized CHY-type Zn-finger protein
MSDELTCPNCGKRMRYDFQQSKIMCSDCNYSPLDAKMAEAQARGPRPEIDITHRGQVNHNAMAAFRTGHDLLYKGDRQKALDSFRRSLRFQADFADAHFWIAELSDEEKIKREHLGIILAHDPSHPEALRKLMILNGRLTPEQAARTRHYDDPQLQQVEEPVKAETQVLLCPVCSGNLTINDESGRVECRFCGHVEQREPAKGSGFDSLAMALIERKARGVKWVIGERLLHCNECGAERTIPARKLSENCPFCGSTHVIVQDALKSFEQPDGLVPFSISREEAGANIKAQLGSVSQRIANLFDNNRVKSALLDGVYLPFWVFDAMADITETRTYKGSSRDSRFVMANTQTRSTYTDGVYNVLVCAVHSPPASITDQLGKYKLDAVIPYDTKLLAKYPAELYSIDFDKASLDARSKVSAIMREKHGRKDTGDEQVQISIFSAVRDMTFRLLLLPVWVATLTEEDGDIRAAFVNGQTGKVVLGKAQKRRK